MKDGARRETGLQDERDNDSWLETNRCVVPNAPGRDELSEHVSKLIFPRFSVGWRRYGWYLEGMNGDSISPFGEIFLICVGDNEMGDDTSAENLH